MIKVLFVCLGNICRSPMAEMVFKDIVNKNNLSDRFYIDSVATCSETTGDEMYYETRNILVKHNVPYTNHVARKLKVEDYENCEKWCRRAIYEYPNTLSSYTCQLKLYFNSGQKERFFAVIEELKQSAIVIDSETLELLRVFR